LRSGTARTLLSPALSFLVLTLALHRLTPAEYGVWAVVASAMAVGGLGDLGVRNELIRRVAVAHGAGDPRSLAAAVSEGVAISSAGGLVLALAGWVAAPGFVAIAFPRSEAISISSIVLLVRAVVLLLALALVTETYFGALAGVQRSDLQNWAQLGAGVTSAVVTCISVLAGRGVWAFFDGFLGGFLIAAAAQFIAMRRLLPTLRIRPKLPNWRFARGYVALSSMLFLSQISNLIDFELDKTLLSRYVSTVASAQYDVGSSITMQMRGVALLPLVLLMPGVAELWPRLPNRALGLYDTVSRFVVGAGAAIFGTCVILAPVLLRLWLGSGYHDAGVATQLLSIAMFANVVSACGVGWAIGRGWHALSAVGALTNILVNGITSYVLIIGVGLRGALIGSIAGNVAATVVFLLLLRRREPMVWRRGLGVPVLGFTLVCLVDALLELSGSEGAGATLTRVALSCVVAVVAIVLLSRPKALGDSASSFGTGQVRPSAVEPPLRVLRPADAPEGMRDRTADPAQDGRPRPIHSMH